MWIKEGYCDAFQTEYRYQKNSFFAKDSTALQSSDEYDILATIYETKVNTCFFVGSGMLSKVLPKDKKTTHEQVLETVREYWENHFKQVADSLSQFSFKLGNYTIKGNTDRLKPFIEIINDSGTGFFFIAQIFSEACHSVEYSIKNENGDVFLNEETHIDIYEGAPLLTDKRQFLFSVIKDILPETDQFFENEKRFAREDFFKNLYSQFQGAYKEGAYNEYCDFVGNVQYLRPEIGKALNEYSLGVNPYEGNG